MSPQPTDSAASSANASSSPATSTSSIDTPISSQTGQASASLVDVVSVSPSDDDDETSLTVQDKQAKARVYKDEGNKLFLAGTFEEAMQKYGQAIALDPSVSTLYTNRAACALKLEKYGSAIEDATKAIELDSKFAKAYHRRASAHLSLFAPKEALPDLKVVAQLEPKNATVRAQLDATVKLIRKLEFGKALEVSTAKASDTIDQYLREGTGGTLIADDYKGPRLQKGDDRQTEHLGTIDQQFIDEMVEFFKTGGKLPHKYAWQIILGALRQFSQEPSLVDFPIPEGTHIHVVGDTHGQFFDFVHLLGLTAKPTESHAILFNGDFVDRGPWSVEIALTIFAYKWLYPKTTLINRGNHETIDLNSIYGFEGECKAKFGGNLTFKLFSEIFDNLPLATLITAPKQPLKADQLPPTASVAQREPILSKENGLKRFFVVHGGLPSKDGVTLDEIRTINRSDPFKNDRNELMKELLWSDPQVANGRSPSQRGVGLSFGPNVTKAWCELNRITAILRSHEVRMGGYTEEHEGRCCTVFSAPNYCDSVGNLGAFARIDDEGTIHWTTFSAQPHPNVKSMAYAQGGVMGGMS